MFSYGLNRAEKAFKVLNVNMYHFLWLFMECLHLWNRGVPPGCRGAWHNTCPLQRVGMHTQLRRGVSPCEELGVK